MMQFNTIAKEDREALIRAIVHGTIYKEFRVEPDEKGTASVVAYFNSGSRQTVIANADLNEANYLMSIAYKIKYDTAQVKVKASLSSFNNTLGLATCPFCGSDDLILHEEKTKDSRITWSRILHPATSPCGISMLGGNKELLIEKWNQRHYFV